MVTNEFDLQEIIEQNPISIGGWNKDFVSMLDRYNMLPKKKVVRNPKVTTGEQLMSVDLEGALQEIKDSKELDF